MIKNYKFKQCESNVVVTEFKVDNNTVLTLVGDNTKTVKVVNDLDNKWFDENGYKEVAGINAGFFMGDGTDCGILYTDYGYNFNGDYTAKDGIQAAIFMNGKLIIDDIDIDSFNALYKGAYWICEASYSVIKNNKKDFSGKEHYSHATEKHPRTMLGQKEDGTLLFVTVDGRSKTSKGVNIEQQYEIMSDLGCINAINFDGGGSTQHTFDGKLVNKPSGSNLRKVASALKVYSKDDHSNEVEENPEDNNEVRIYKIAQDAGHGLPTPARRTIGNEVQEWAMNSRVAEKVPQLLKGYNVEFLRVDDPTGEVDVKLVDRTSKANDWKADIYLSYHHNYFKKDVGTGVEVYRPFGDNTGFGEMLVNKLSKYTGLYNRGCKTKSYSDSKPTTSYYHVNRETDMLGYLIEGGFMSNTKLDIPIIESEEGSHAYAKAVADSLIEYFGLVKIEDEPVDPEPTEPQETYRKVFTVPDIGEHTKCKFIFTDVKKGMEIYVKETK